ncbi:hypothetical protein CAPTEDRAFT_196527 [Capitella teleta]|uniref:Uncharacterized protein n=1 Tax=Capitella teleta TaxID=283909 RepID=R7UVG5_CAPTE|nr:hypothetical protein CAPTEDRAFT_196527 [Capitella teleta]|eukprot:ELU10289.1 hypothetical protein CAPTEDRAFT_196527 [Capitella teleta]
MTDTNGKYQEGHQHRVKIKTVSKGGQQTHLPYNRSHRRQQWNNRTLQTSGIEKQQNTGYANGNNKEPDNGFNAFKQVTENLGNTGNMQVNTLFSIFAAQFFKLIGKGHPVGATLANNHYKPIITGGESTQRHTTMNQNLTIITADTKP